MISTAAMMFFLLTAPSSSHMEPVPVILDTDIGDDIDDTWALVMMLGRPEIDVKLIVSASGDVHKKAALTAKLLEIMGRVDIPVGIGKPSEGIPFHMSQFLGDYDIESYPGTVHEDGIDAMIKMIHASDTPITICAIGPLTNLAEALRRDPSIAEKARVVCMAGSVYMGYHGKATPDIEYNVKMNIPAAQAVFTAPWEIVMTPVDSCGQVRITGEKFAALQASDNPRIQTILEAYETWDARHHHPEDASSVLFDTVAVYLTYATDLVRMETVSLVVDDEGRTKPDENGKPVHCALEMLEPDAMVDLIIESISQDSKTGR